MGGTFDPEPDKRIDPRAWTRRRSRPKPDDASQGKAKLDMEPEIVHAYGPKDADRSDDQSKSDEPPAHAVVSDEHIASVVFPPKIWSGPEEGPGRIGGM